MLQIVDFCELCVMFAEVCDGVVHLDQIAFGNPIMRNWVLRE